MKAIKNHNGKVLRDKITFRINLKEDKKIIEYIDKSNNGSGFIKEAIKFYIIALEQGIVKSEYLTKKEDVFKQALSNLNTQEREENENIYNKENYKEFNEGFNGEYNINDNSFNIDNKTYTNVYNKENKEANEDYKTEATKNIYTLKGVNDRVELDYDDLFDFDDDDFI